MRFIPAVSGVQLPPLLPWLMNSAYCWILIALPLKEDRGYTSSIHNATNGGFSLRGSFMSSGTPVCVLAVTTSVADGHFLSGRNHSINRPYLLYHRHSLIFRIRVPAAIQGCLGRKEYRRSLGPSYTKDAKAKSLKLAAAAHEVFALARAIMETRKNEAMRTATTAYTNNGVDSEERPVTQENELPEGVYPYPTDI